MEASSGARKEPSAAQQDGLAVVANLTEACDGTVTVWGCDFQYDGFIEQHAGEKRLYCIGIENGGLQMIQKHLRLGRKMGMILLTALSCVVVVSCSKLADSPPSFQRPGAAPSGKSSSDERFKVADSGVSPDPKATGATKEGGATVEEKIAWGKEKGGLVMNIRALKTEVQTGEPIEFEIRVKNVSDKDVILPSGAGDKMHCAWNFYFDQWLRRHGDYQLLLPSLAEKKGHALKPGETGSTRYRFATTGQTFRHMQNQTETERLPEGIYHVRAEFTQAVSGQARPESNTVEVRITALSR